MAQAQQHHQQVPMMNNSNGNGAPKRYPPNTQGAALVASPMNGSPPPGTPAVQQIGALMNGNAPIQSPQQGDQQQHHHHQQQQQYSSIEAQPQGHHSAQQHFRDATGVTENDATLVEKDVTVDMPFTLRKLMNRKKLSLENGVVPFDDVPAGVARVPPLASIWQTKRTDEGGAEVLKGDPSKAILKAVYVKSYDATRLPIPLTVAVNHILDAPDNEFSAVSGSGALFVLEPHQIKDFSVNLKLSKRESETRQRFKEKATGMLVWRNLSKVDPALYQRYGNITEDDLLRGVTEGPEVFVKEMNQRVKKYHVQVNAINMTKKNPNANKIVPYLLFKNHNRIKEAPYYEDYEKLANQALEEHIITLKKPTLDKLYEIAREGGIERVRNYLKNLLRTEIYLCHPLGGGLEAGFDGLLEYIQERFDPDQIDSILDAPIFIRIRFCFVYALNIVNQ